MNKIDIKGLIDEANSKIGVLHHLRTDFGRRKMADEDYKHEEPLLVDNEFESDEGRLDCSKAVRNMDAKTQVFTLPGNRLIRTRGAHVREVKAVSIIAANMLGLNTSLVRAAAIGHDMGHVPLGHQGEKWLAKQMGRPDFCHEQMGVIVAQKIERAGMGLNLCHETLQAMQRHSGKMAVDDMTAEAWILRYGDKIAYLFHDYNDLQRVGFQPPKTLLNAMDAFGSNQRERTTTAISGLVVESAFFGKVSFEQSDVGKSFQEIRSMMYEVYPRVTKQNVDDILGPVLEFLDDLKIGDPFLLLALMNDEDVFKIKNHTGMKDMILFNQTSVSEIIPHLEKIGKVDMCDPDMGW